MKKITLLFFMSTWLMAGYGQLQLQPMLTDGGMTNMQMLWRVMIQNGFTDAVEAKVKLEVIEKGNRVAAFVVVSKDLLLKKGAGNYQLSDFMPLQVLQNNSTHNWYNPNEWLSPGQYQLVYSVISSKGGAESFSIPLDVQPLSPPELVLPEDSAVVMEKRPVFSWLPPVPSNMFKNLSYEIKVVQLNNVQQSADKAIRQNKTILYKNNLQQNTYTLGTQDPVLEKGKYYAWQITAKDGESYKISTPVWVFRLLPDSIMKLIDEMPYVLMTSRFSETTNMYDGYLKFNFDNRNSDTKINIQIEDASTGQVILKKAHPIQFGNNAILFKNPVTLEPDKIYLLTVTNNSNEHYQLRFTPYYSK